MHHERCQLFWPTGLTSSQLNNWHEGHSWCVMTIHQ